jgi:hypothetical protein
VLHDYRGFYYLQAWYLDVDIDTGKKTEQHTHKWLISTYATKGEIVQTCFKLVMTSMEHRAREGFLYRGRRVFGPQFDLDALWSIADGEHLDIRPDARGADE